MTKRFPTDYPVLNPLGSSVVILGDDGTQTGQVNLQALIAGLGAGAGFSSISATATTLVSGQSATATGNVAGGVLALSFGLPAGQAGTNGAVGALGPIGYQGVANGSWNASTNVPTFTAGGGGGTAGQVYTVSVAGVQSITGTSLSYAVGDQVQNIAGTSWIKLTYAGAASAFTTITLGGLTYSQDDGSGIPGWLWLDKSGGIAMSLNASGLSAYQGNFQTLSSTSASITSLTVGTLTAPLSTQTDASGATLFAVGAESVTVPGGIVTFSTNFEIANSLGQIGFAYDFQNLWISGNVHANAFYSNGVLLTPGTSALVPQLDSSGNTLLAIGASSVSLPGAMTVTETTGANPFEISNLLGQIGLIFDGANLTVAGNVVSSAGTLGSGGGGSSSTTFSAQDIANFDASNLAFAASVISRGNTTAQRGTAQYNIQLVVGQSRSVGTYGSPPVNVTQPLDVLQLGQSTRCEFKTSGDSNLATFTAQGDNYFHPCVATQQSNDNMSLVPVRTGALVNVQNVSASFSTYGTITWPTQVGINAASIFAAGDGFQMQGFTVATGNNANPTNCNTFTVHGTPTNNMILTVEAPVATTSAENGITIAEANWGGYGEDCSVAANNEYRQQQLNQRGLRADSTRLNVVTVIGIAYVIPLQCPTYNNITPSPLLFNRISSGLLQAQATAAAGGNGYPPGTALLQSIYMAAGGDEAGSGVPKATFRAEMDFWFKSIVASAYTAFGSTQTADPFQYSFVVSGGQLSDGQLPNNYNFGNNYAQCQYVTYLGNTYQCATAITSATTGPTGTGLAIPDGTGTWNYISATPATPDACGVTMAALELMGCSPLTGFPFNYAGINPNRYIVGPEFPGPDRGPHGNNMGYAWTGAQIGKVRTKVEILGQGWMPCHVLNVYVRGQYIYVGCNVPQAPLQVQCPFLYDSPQTIPFFGFTASDSAGVISFTSAVLAGKTGILINAGRTVNAATLVLRYAAQASTGCGMICDSDPWVPVLSKYNFTLGSGQLLTDNFPNAAYAGGPIIQNGQPFPLWNWLCPGAWPGTAI